MPDVAASDGTTVAFGALNLQSGMAAAAVSDSCSDPATVQQLDEMKVVLKEEGLLDTLSKHQGKESLANLLARFLRARKGNVPAAVKLLREDLKWRDDEDILGLRYSSASQVLRGQENPAGKALHDAQVPSGLLGHDKMGRPVMFIEVGGKFNANKLESEGELVHSHLQRFQWWLSERVFDTVGQEGQVLWIVDVSGWHLSQMSSKKNVKYMMAIAEVASAHYPERMARTVIINAPRVFSAAWRMVRPMLDITTQNKIDILSGQDKWLPKLAEHIDIALLPEHLGGKTVLCFDPHSLDPQLFPKASKP
mmetsp:Transcript_56967/g.135301  ORF Transcript_56967/g.135301 Transcript_56967/m.135301 type:complete len:308 (+) Transcript_56967:105-1028(+)